MTLPVLSITTRLTPSGRRDARYENGDDGNTVLLFSPIPDIRGVQEGTTPTYDLRALGLTEPGSPLATITLDTLVDLNAAGWTFDGTNLAYSGTGIATVTVRMSATRLGFTAVSPYTFIVETIASGGADATAPTIVTGVTVVPTAGQGNLVSFLQACDNKVGDLTGSNVKEYDIYRNGVLKKTLAAGGTGVVPQFAAVVFGAPEGPGSVVQGTGVNGTTYTITSQGPGFGGVTGSGGATGGGDSGTAGVFQLSGDWRFECIIQSVTGSVIANTPICLAVFETPVSGSRGLFHRVSSTGGIRTRYRNTANGTTLSSGTTITGVSWPTRLRVDKVGDTYTTSYGNNATVVATPTVALGTSPWLALFPGTGDVGTIVATITQVCVQSLAPLSWMDPITDGSSCTYTIVAKDNALNASAASTGVTVTAPIVVGGSLPLTPAVATAPSGTASGGAADTTPPTVPTSPSATGVSPTSVNVVFGLSTDTQSGVSRYKLHRAPASSGPFVTQTDLITASNYVHTIAGATPSTQYWFQLSAVDGAGNESARSITFAATTTATAGALAIFLPWNGTMTLPPSGFAGSDNIAPSPNNIWEITNAGPVFPGFSNPGSTHSYHIQITRVVANNDYRNEIDGFWNAPNFTDIYYGFAIYVPKNVLTGYTPNLKAHTYPRSAIFLQTHHTNIPPTAVQVPFAIYIDQGSWGFWTIFHEDPYDGAAFHNVPGQGSIRNRQLSRFDVENNISYGDAFHHIDYDTWTRWGLRIRFDCRNSLVAAGTNLGRVEITKNNVLVATLIRPIGIGPLSDGRQNTNNVKSGIYAVKSESSPAPLNVINWYISTIRVAVGSGRLAEVLP